MALISTTGPICPNVTDTPLDNRSRVSRIAGIGNIPLAWKGMLVYCEENGITYKVTSLKPKRSGPVEIENYYPATWVEFGSGGSTPSPTPSAIDAGDVTYSSGGTFSDGTVGKELQSLASNIGTLSTSIGSKVSGIQVTGESNPRYPVDGIVTIPAGGGGTGTITGATVGGNPVTASGGILQFDAYPTVPITGIETSDHTTLEPNKGLVTLPSIPDASTANTMLYSDAGSYDSGSIGKALKDSRADIKSMWGDLHPVEQQDSTPVTSLDLNTKESSGDSFTYSDDTVYFYNGSNTSKIVYNNNSTNYAVFKVNDVDKYIRYTITESSNVITYTFEGSYTLNNLPSEARKLFEISRYAAVKIITGTRGDSFTKDRYSVFVDSDNRPLQNDFYEEVISSVNSYFALFKDNKTKDLYLYKLNTSTNNYAFSYKKSSTDSDYAIYDAHFGASSADKISFNDTVLHTGYDNVQDVLQVMYSNIQGYVTELKINLKYPNSNPIVNKQVNITVYWHGEVYDLSSQYTPGFSGFKTDSNGNITIIIPYGSTYNLSFVTLNNDYLTPEPISGTSDLNSITHNVTYTAISNNENVIPTVYIASGSPSVSLDNKIVYIDTIDSSDNVLISHYRKGVLNSVGRLKAVYDENNTLLNDPVIEIARGVRYRIYLDLWDSTIPADNQSYVASPLQIYTASKARRLINLWYTNVSVGIFLAIKNNNSEKGYDSYRMFEVDNPTENSSIGVTINNIDYEVYKNGNDIYKKQVGSSTSEPWIEYVNINTILGVGIKTIELESEQGQDSTIDSLGYSSLSIMLLRSVPYSNVAIQEYASPAFPFYNFKDGMYVTRLWYNYGEGNTSPAAQYAIDSCTIQLVTENGTINIPAFIPSQLQIKPIIANYEFLVNVFYTINGTLPVALTNGSTLSSSSMSGNSSGYLPGRYISWTKTNINTGFISANIETPTIFVYPFR